MFAKGDERGIVAVVVVNGALTLPSIVHAAAALSGDDARDV